MSVDHSKMGPVRRGRRGKNEVERGDGWYLQDIGRSISLLVGLGNVARREQHLVARRLVAAKKLETAQE